MDCVSRCLGHSNLATYQGCYEDKNVRDLPKRLGGGKKVNPEDCFREARKVKDINFVGL